MRQIYGAKDTFGCFLLSKNMDMERDKFMSKILIVAEKPSAGKDIARILGITTTKNGYMENEEYIVTWARGHMVGLKDPDEVDVKYQKWNVEDLPLPYDNGLKVLAGTRDQFKIVKDLIQREDISCLINAGDAGREGLLIQSWIYRMCGNRHPVKILWASSLTDDAIKSAMGRLHDENEPEFTNLLREAETRAVADQVYGYNYTRALTCLYSSPGTVLSYGRCQTPLLNLIYKRDLEIEKFKSVPYWRMNAEFDSSFTACEIDDNGKNRMYMEKSAAEEAYKSCGKQGQVKVCKKEQKVQKAPALFNLAEIQGTMGKKYGLKPDETLEIAQKLYETHKIMSYPRTDSRYLSTDLYGEIAEHVKSCSFGKFKEYIDPINFSAFSMDKAYFNNNKVSDHHALIPTINSNMEEIYHKLLSDMERNFFDEIVSSLIAIFYPPYKYEITEILIEVSERTFLANGSIVKDAGYKKVQAVLGKPSEKQNSDQQLPDLTEGQLLAVTNLELKEEKTKPPARYNPGNIVKLMNKYKIGTSATSANIIQTLEKRKFIILDEKKKYKTTELGRSFIDRVPDVLKAAELTIEFENKLSKVNCGDLTKDQFIQDIIEQIKVNINTFKKDAPEKKIVASSDSIGACPKCGKPMGESGKSWYCSGYADDPKCNFTIWKKISNKAIPASAAKALVNNGRTDLIKGFKSSQGKEFSAYLVIKEDHAIGFEFPKRK